METLNLAESIRKRPSMYIGSTDPRGLYYLVFEVVKECINLSNKANVLIEIRFDENDTIYITCHFPSGIIFIDKAVKQ